MPRTEAQRLAAVGALGSWSKKRPPEEGPEVRAIPDEIHEKLLDESIDTFGDIWKRMADE